MKCVICKNGQTVNQTITVTLEQNGKTLVFKEVPARVCENCGEQYLEEETSRRLLSLAQEAAKSGIELTIAKFKAA
jgi:YgiT-type zinc finger domain-containing protein